MTSKHTPGPWTARFSTVKAEIFGPDGEWITETRILRMGKTGWEEIPGRAANVHLMTAAPDMLEALTALLESLNDDPKSDTVVEAMARAALAKAEGKP